MLEEIKIEEMNSFEKGELLVTKQINKIKVNSLKIIL